MCCGRTNFQAVTPPQHALANAAPIASARGPRFKYIGKTALTVVSPITGNKYRFTQPSEQLEVDARDQSWITFVPNLVRVA
jgi:hypothetical protein